MDLSPAQIEIMKDFDGLAGIKEYNGTYSRSISRLEGLGLVTANRQNYMIKLRGYPASYRMRIHVKLTQKGADFIYNGGLDGDI